MVVAQIPLWIQHSTGSAPSTNGNANSTFALLEAKDSQWTNNRRSAIYAIDIAGPRIATGGGDGMVRIWSIDALFASSKSKTGTSTGMETEGTEAKMAQFSSKGYVSSDTSDTDASASDAAAGRNGENGEHDHSDASMEEEHDDSASASKSRKRKRNEKHSKDGKHKHASNRLLCKISSHSGSVLTLRFSTSHKILASAGDDSHVILYAQSSTPNLAATGNLVDDTNNMEHWSRIRICRGHNLDVVGLAWAPDDSHLISCSLDSDAPICVWRMDFDGTDADAHHGNGISDHLQANPHKTIMQPYKVLGVKEHTSTVKGVAFDPAGKYIASSGDDPSLCIWRAFDDWGLESRIDSSSGIFQEDVQSLANLSLFRRISFAPDGTHICTTNAMLKKKNIAAMVSRDGWGVSAKKNSNVAGAANLVGHKQPVVSSRHCPFLFGRNGENSGAGGNANDVSDEGDEEAQPDYSTLVALGDKKGMVTIWSTKKSRPIFKLQCSESRCTVTDMAWGLMPSKTTVGEGTHSLVMLISLLDGFTVALRFNTEEVGPMLSEDKKNTIFRLKYGIDLTSLNGKGASRRRLVDDTSGPKLIENVLQYEMEENDDDDDLSNEADDDHLVRYNGTAGPAEPKVNTMIDVRKKQVESRSKSTGKKRIQPVLMTVEGNQGDSSTPSQTSLEQRMNGGKNANAPNTNTDGNATGENNATIERAATLAEEASAKAKRSNISHGGGNLGNNAAQIHSNGQRQYQQQPPTGDIPIQMHVKAASLPVENKKIFSVDLSCPETTSVLESSMKTRDKIVASSSNSIQTLPGMSTSTACTTISISKGNTVSWRDHLVGAHCTALDACSTVLAFGSYDGTIYLYSTSPVLGWESGVAFRSHPPFVLSGSIVRLSLKESEETHDSVKSVEMLVVTSDASFSIFTIIPEPKLQLKGTIMPAMNQMRLSGSHRLNQKNDASMFPELAKIMITDSKQLLLILCHKAKSTEPVGGILQGFVYNRNMESWMRVSDDRFMFSKLFSTIPRSKLKNGLLSKIDQVVQSSSGNASSSHRRGKASCSSASEMYYVNENDESSLQSFATKAHCEDRLACALALQSKPDFEHWLRLYVRTLSMEADTVNLRLVVSLLLDKIDTNGESAAGELSKVLSCWWLSSTPTVLGINRRETVAKIIIPEMTKNRALQRLANEFATEIKTVL